LDRLRFSTTDVVVFRNVTTILVSATGRSIAVDLKNEGWPQTSRRFAPQTPERLGHPATRSILQRGRQRHGKDLPVYTDVAQG
jgi:hypothetical protein